MKILLLSAGSDDFTEEAMEIFSESGIGVIAKPATGGTREFCNAAEDAILRRGYDLVIGNADDYISVGIELNKNRGIRAAAINSKRDLRISLVSKPNVMIVNEDIALIRELAASMHGHNSGPAAQRPARRTLDAFAGALQWRVQREGSGQEAEHKAAHKERRPQREEDAREAVEEDAEYAERHSRGSGILGRLRDSLGIIDERDA
ncbi:MAG: hypothetical protein M1321_00335 [Candidatus Marsarchaeota archaeon]|jgi:hypothetical protein|nr:hypothetical protein [Candidatus Marsarchaeota archaeon]